MKTKCNDKDCPQSFVDGFCDLCGCAEGLSALTGAEVRNLAIAPKIEYRLFDIGPIFGSPQTMTTAVFPAMKTTYRNMIKNEKQKFIKNDIFVWPLPICEAITPESRVIKNPVVKGSRSVCSGCGKEVSANKKYCGSCGVEYPYALSLKHDEMVAEQYNILGPIAFGGLGWIYLARDIRLDRYVVLKGLINTKDQSAAAAAVLEKQYLSTVSHPSIVAIQNFIKHKGHSYIVMEYVDGISLKYLRSQHGPLRVHEALGCILSILPSLQVLHDMGMVYCDMKPDNIILQPTGGVKLIDLGAVRMIDDITEDMYGSDGFRPAPINDESPTPSIALDIYTLGRTLATLLLDFDSTGENQFSFPPVNSVNRIIGSQELINHLGQDYGDVSFLMINGDALPSWLQVSHLKNKYNEWVYVLHGFAPEGFQKIDIQMKGHNSQSTVISLSCPLANTSIQALLERACHSDAEGRFTSCSEMYAQCAGVLREIMGNEGLPINTYFPFSPFEASMDFYNKSWHMLPVPVLKKSDGAFDEVVMALEETLLENRCTALGDMVKTGSHFHLGMDPHLRYVENMIHLISSANMPVVENEEKILHFLRLATQLNPWDWRPSWMEGKYRMFRCQYAEAVACFDKVSRILPGEIIPKFALGCALEGVGQYALGIKFYEQTLSVFPHYHVIRFMRIRCMYNSMYNDFYSDMEKLLIAYPVFQNPTADFLIKNFIETDFTIGEWQLKQLLKLNEANPQFFSYDRKIHIHKLAISLLRKYVKNSISINENKSISIDDLIKSLKLNYSLAAKHAFSLKGKFNYHLSALKLTRLPYYSMKAIKV